ncbi:hypothetical protein OA320_03735, partial [Prochlorococcus sp. AH-716-O10]|nr:hypothetical protein [Prochlorococcus sp. AH-716-O10]
YTPGRKKGLWWKYKVDPMQLDAVLIYAKGGSGIRAGLYTDYSFALWKDGELIKFASAYSGLNNTEIKELDKWIRNNTIDRFGPVRSVRPEMVFEISFENIQISKRHKSGIMAGVLLALGRAMGETMAVTMIIGNSNAFSWSLLSPGYTISSMLANQFGEADGSQVSSLFYAAFVLMILSLVVNIFAQWLVKKFSLKY